ncbi:barstar family protein [Streptomyces sp. NPDC049555]|uniref:barstar family protein n=1 Tax=Streptomyces sp. NPDC049555 TaxID=3154930 RepID=UPI0034162EB9
MDGADMADADGVFEQFWEKLKFPDYFGWNWPALLDCLRDLHWLPADHYMIIVRRSGLLLSSVADERAIFLRTMMRAAEDWVSPQHRRPGGASVPFNVVLFCDDSEVDGLRRELREVGGQ